ncbi:winged helix domain-containing protein [Pseudopontixanthobacter vadosimaris]|uniref:winged helix domain-containing protein n=1 Tax=Pseudopontixanthobacter vadosimaris TaxID=2726450 RepID=UPI003B82EDB5
MTGQTARTLLALVNAGATGVTALEVASWAFRLSHSVMVLRHKHRLAIPMKWEAHERSKHGRYVLRSTVTIIEVTSV